MKHLFISSLILLLMSSCKKEIGQATLSNSSTDNVTSAARLGATEKVKLWKARTVAAYLSASYIREKAFYVEVDSAGTNKSVFVHHKMSDGSWQNFPLSFKQRTNMGSEIWGWEINYGVGTPLANTFASVGFADEFAVRYNVSGQTYWDNNNNSNYNISHFYFTDGMFMQNGLNINADTYHSYFKGDSLSGTVQIFADVRNLAFAKEITLVYSTNNWKTIKYMPLTYANTYAYGGANFRIDPNAKNFEKWAVTVKPSRSAKKIVYALRYRINGAEYWDNNFGRNYTMVKKPW